MTRASRIRATASLLILLGALSGCVLPGRCGEQECREEAALRAAVEASYARYPELRPPNELHVQVHGHVVTISGQVNTEYERRLAESVAHETKGVARVINFVGLTYSGR